MLPAKDNLLWRIVPGLFLLVLSQLLICQATLKSVHVEEAPFGLNQSQRSNPQGSQGIHAISQIEKSRQFLHLFNVPYIVCIFAAKGKWPLIPPMMQPRVDEMARTFFLKNDSYIRQFCQKWIAIKECFRPLLGFTTPSSELDARRGGCVCPTPSSVVYFDRDHIGEVSSDVIQNTIEFLESFLPEPTKRYQTNKRKKPKISSRLDELDID